MLNLLTATAFRAIIETDESGKIINAPDFMSNFKGLQLKDVANILQNSRNKFQSVSYVEIEEP